MLFARYGLDVEDFTVLYHRISINDVVLIMLHMHHTPLDSESEQYETLQRILKQGIMRPSESDWATTPVSV